MFASPKATDAYKKDGHFPNGTVLVKEVFEAATASMTTGTVSHPGKLKGWFVMVRDGSDRYQSKPLWGDGWGWSWFDAGILRILRRPITGLTAAAVMFPRKPPNGSTWADIHL